MAAKSKNYKSQHDSKPYSPKVYIFYQADHVKESAPARDIP